MRYSNSTTLLLVANLSQYLNTGRKELHGWLVAHHIFIHCSTDLIKQGGANVVNNF